MEYRPQGFSQRFCETCFSLPTGSFGDPFLSHSPLLPSHSVAPSKKVYTIYDLGSFLGVTCSFSVGVWMSRVQYMMGYVSLLVVYLEWPLHFDVYQEKTSVVWLCSFYFHPKSGFVCTSNTYLVSSHCHTKTLFGTIL